MDSAEDGYETHSSYEVVTPPRKPKRKHPEEGINFIAAAVRTDDKRILKLERQVSSLCAQVSALSSSAAFVDSSALSSRTTALEVKVEPLLSKTPKAVWKRIEEFEARLNNLGDKVSLKETPVSLDAVVEQIQAKLVVWKSDFLSDAQALVDQALVEGAPARATVLSDEERCEVHEILAEKIDIECDEYRKRMDDSETFADRIDTRMKLLESRISTFCVANPSVATGQVAKPLETSYVGRFQVTLDLEAKFLAKAICTFARAGDFRYSSFKLTELCRHWNIDDSARAGNFRLDTPRTKIVQEPLCSALKGYAELPDEYSCLLLLIKLLDKAVVSGPCRR